MGWHLPPTQAPPWHECPQAPQFAPSVLVSAHVLPHTCCVAPHLQVPDEQCFPPVHAVALAHVVPHVASELRSLHALPHNERPPLQTHPPELQFELAGHWWPQAPQLALSTCN